MKPALSPIVAPDLVCGTCGAVLRRVIHTQASNGKLDKIVYHCDSGKCQYAINITKEHVNCQDDKYDNWSAAPEPEPIKAAEKPKVKAATADDDIDAKVVPSAVQTSNEV